MIKKLKNKQKGITLVALIITIIVLLILATVAIRSISGEGIIEHAKNSTELYERVSSKEERASYKEKFNIKDEQGIVSKSDVQDALKKMYGIEQGDFVNYKANVEGYNDEEGWKVLGYEDGKVLIVSTRNIGGIILSDEDYYKEGIDKLNNLCVPFGNGDKAKGARSIKVEDINRLTGYNPENYGKGTLNENGLYTTFKRQNNEVEYNSINGSGICDNINPFYYFNGKDFVELEDGKSITIKNTSYDYLYNDEIDNTLMKEKELSILENNPKFWCASHYVLFEYEESQYWLMYCYFESFVDGLYGDNGLCEGISGQTLEYHSNVRAVVYLDEDTEFIRQNDVNEEVGVYDIR